MFESIVLYLFSAVFLVFLMTRVIRYVNRPKELTLLIHEDREIKIKFMNGYAVWFAETEMVDTENGGVHEILNIVRDKFTGTLVHSLYSTPSRVMDSMDLAVNVAGNKIQDALSVYLRSDTRLVVALSEAQKNGT